MLKRDHIEKLLTLNGVSKDAPDDQIKAVLLSAHWHKEDVESALVVLRENPKTHEESIKTVHRVFSSDDRLNAQTVNALLGIEMEASSLPRHTRLRKKNGHTPSFYISVVLAGLLVSVLFILWLMWNSRIGLFHVANS